MRKRAPVDSDSTDDDHPSNVAAAVRKRRQKAILTDDDDGNDNDEEEEEEMKRTRQIPAQTSGNPRSAADSDYDDDDDDDLAASSSSRPVTRARNKNETGRAAAKRADPQEMAPNKRATTRVVNNGRAQATAAATETTNADAIARSHAAEATRGLRAEDFAFASASSDDDDEEDEPSTPKRSQRGSPRHSPRHSPGSSQSRSSQSRLPSSSGRAVHTKTVTSFVPMFNSYNREREDREDASDVDFIVSDESDEDGSGSDNHASSESSGEGDAQGSSPNDDGDDESPPTKRRGKPVARRVTVPKNVDNRTREDDEAASDDSSSQTDESRQEPAPVRSGARRRRASQQDHSVASQEPSKTKEHPPEFSPVVRRKRVILDDDDEDAGADGNENGNPAMLDTPTTESSKRNRHGTPASTGRSQSPTELSPATRGTKRPLSQQPSQRSHSGRAASLHRHRDDERAAALARVAARKAGTLSVFEASALALVEEGTVSKTLGHDPSLEMDASDDEAEDDEDDAFVVSDDEEVQSAEVTECTCGSSADYSGLMVCCTGRMCRKWQHAACVNIIDEDDIPDNYKCMPCRLTAAGLSASLAEQPSHAAKRRRIVDDGSDGSDDDNPSAAQPSQSTTPLEQLEYHHSFRAAGARLYRACQAGDVVRVKKLLESSSVRDAHAINYFAHEEANMTPFIAAVSGNHVEVARLLLDTALVRTQLCTLSNQTALRVAIKSGDSSMWELLSSRTLRATEVHDDLLDLAAGAPTTIPLQRLLERRGQSPAAASSGTLSQKPLNNPQARTLWRLLQVAAAQGSLACVEFLLGFPEVCTVTTHLWQASEAGTLGSQLDREQRRMTTTLLAAQKTHSRNWQRDQESIEAALPFLTDQAQASTSSSSSGRHAVTFSDSGVVTASQPATSPVRRLDDRSNRRAAVSLASILNEQSRALGVLGGRSPAPDRELPNAAVNRRVNQSRQRLAPPSAASPSSSPSKVQPVQRAIQPLADTGHVIVRLGDSDDGETLVHQAVLSGQVNVLTVILDALPPQFLFFADDDGITPLWLACSMGHSDCVQEIASRIMAQRAGLEPDIAEVQFSTSNYPASVALDSTKALLHPLVCCDVHGTTALHCAAAIGSLPCVETLLCSGHPVYLLDENGWTPLLYSVFKERKDCIRPLMRAMPAQLKLLTTLIHPNSGSSSQWRAARPTDDAVYAATRNQAVVARCVTMLAEVPEYYALINAFVASESSLLDSTLQFLVTRYPTCLTMENKLAWMYRQLNLRRPGQSWLLKLDRSHLLDSLSEGCHTFQSAFGLQVSVPNVQFRGEPATGWGPRREMFALLAGEVIRPDYQLFSVIDKGRDAAASSAQAANNNVDQGQDGAAIVPVSAFALSMDPNDKTLRHRRMYSIGLAVGYAIATKENIPATFSSAFWKLVLGKPVDLDDLDTVDPALSKSLSWLLSQDIAGMENDLAMMFSVDVEIRLPNPTSRVCAPTTNVADEVEGLSDDSFDYDPDWDSSLSVSVVETNRSIVRVNGSGASSSDPVHNPADPFPGHASFVNNAGTMRTFNLCPNGSQTLVTQANKHEFVRARVDFAFKGLREAASEFARGLYSIIPHPNLAVFSSGELALLVAGSSNIDVDDWQQHTKYGDQLSATIIEWFWALVRDLSQSERSLLLQFSTGMCRLPPGGFANLSAMHSQGGQFTLSSLPEDGSHLPRAATCFNLLQLPAYTSETELRQKVLIAIRHGCGGFTFG
ncbi:hypothetical protein CAOG_06100 [Capsaspora owczarzaki ATCC 30864]|uniref:E3 ubiquitin-protein ligase HACE1 n=1 Tax=Capsaspora owczarzaki (strain ATCC 30864) TaxID=595528 RepID=A0A0D2X496_CAPO3|nr:hypothetical protein CAOG_06100 [Capsaspora owczarzaki ATCC 30864]KJE95674.1 hypothetical protein CAOG_006100 [Capsaspora owczarzaki ATCC 30864]|eukprot:XP_004345690.1 hypothetical protein CAOG_06100 [Capsaspora owczarzaki ATCC 30864]